MNFVGSPVKVSPISDANRALLEAIEKAKANDPTLEEITQIQIRFGKALYIYVTPEEPKAPPDFEISFWAKQLQCGWWIWTF